MFDGPLFQKTDSKAFIFIKTNDRNTVYMYR